MIGLNFPADGRVNPQFGALLGAKWLRVVLKPDVDLTPWVSDAYSRGINVLPLIARESLGIDTPSERWSFEQWLESLRNAGIPTQSDATAGALTFNDAAAFYADRYGNLFSHIQIGNESDHESPSSWTLTPDDLNSLLAAFNMHFPDADIVGPGLVSGHPEYLDSVDLDLLGGVAVHGYGTTPNAMEDWSETPGNFGTIAQLLDRYRPHCQGKKFWLTEIGVSTHEVSEAFQARYCEAWIKAAKLRTDVETVFWFCYDDLMV